MARMALLPPNATPFEKALSETLDRLQDLQPGVMELRGFKFSPEPNILPFLVHEYGLADVALYVPDLAEVISQGIEFQRLRGTPAAIHRALTWIGRDGTIEENPPQRVKWWWFQLHLPGEVRSSAFVTDLIGVVKAAKPLRSEFARVTAGYDIRGFMTDTHRLNGGGLLNSWSGVRRAAGEPVLSFRVHHNNVVSYNELGSEIGLYPGEFKSVHHVMKVNGAAPTEQRSGFPSSFATQFASSSDPDVVPFNNAPFTDEPFGVPSPFVQTGY